MPTRVSPVTVHLASTARQCSQILFRFSRHLALGFTKDCRRGYSYGQRHLGTGTRGYRRSMAWRAPVVSSVAHGRRRQFHVQLLVGCDDGLGFGVMPDGHLVRGWTKVGGWRAAESSGIESEGRYALGQDEADSQAGISSPPPEITRSYPWDTIRNDHRVPLGPLDPLLGSPTRPPPPRSTGVSPIHARRPRPALYVVAQAVEPSAYHFRD
jgi:hypothetical protein